MASMASVPPPAAVQAATQHAKAGKASGHSWKLYTVQPGDTLIELAARFGTSVDVLTARNHLVSSGRICVGQHMAVPGKAPAHAAKRSTSSDQHTTTKRTKTKRTTTGHSKAEHHKSKPTKAARAKAARAKAKRPTRSYGHYTVRSGDTLSSIALAHHTTVAALAKANHLTTVNLIQRGRSLQVPAKTATGAAPKRSGKTHAKKHHLSKAERTFAGWTYPEKVVRSAKTTRAYLAKRPAPSRGSVHSLIVKTAHRYGVDPKLALGIGWQESGWNQRAVSIAGAVGVMQVMPDSATWASGLVHHRLNPLDAHDNITAGVVILRYLTGHADHLNQAIGGYYQGLGGVQSHGMLPDTKKYVHAVRAHMLRF